MKIFLLSALLVLVCAPLDSFAQARRGGGGARGGGGRSAPAKRSAPKAAGNRGGAANNRVGNGNRVGNSNKVGGNNKINKNSNNRVSVDNSRKNVNINVDNSRNVNVHNNRRNAYVRRPVRPYVRPPYIYGGRRFYGFHPYVYHPFRPFYWGPVWHPWGFLVTTLAVTAIVVSVNNQKYHYDQGVYYTQTSGGYKVVEAPVGATIQTLPQNSQPVVVNETTNNYYYGGTYYEKSDKGYTVVPPTAGATVENLPEGAEEVTMGDQKYVKYGETYYQPVQVDGKDMYEVANVEDESN